MNDGVNPARGHMEPESLDPLLMGIIRDNREKVVGWMTEQPGCWGFLAGKAVAACRAQKGAPLADQERRLVWHRLWLLLAQVKAQII